MVKNCLVEFYYVTVIETSDLMIYNRHLSRESLDENHLPVIHLEIQSIDYLKDFLQEFAQEFL